MNDLQVRWCDIDKVTPYARNSCKIPERAVDKVAASINEYGWCQPIVVDKDFVVVCGHTRLLAAKKLGLKQVPIHVADNLTPAQIKAYRLMDNRSHDESTFDLELLGPELEELRGLDFDLELTGFDEREIEDLLADPISTTALTKSRTCPSTRLRFPVTCGSVGTTEFSAGVRPARRRCRGCWASANLS